MEGSVTPTAEYGMLPGNQPMSTSAGTGTGSAQHLFKVLVIGDYAVGKTSLIRRYTEGTFTANYKITIGVDFALKVIEWSDLGTPCTVNLQLWDISGHERFHAGGLLRSYFRYAIAACVVFDVTRPNTLDGALKWKEELDSKVMLADGSPIPCLLLANKVDLEEARVSTDQLNAFCTENGFVGHWQVSAKDNLGIGDAMRFLVTEIMDLTTKQRAAERNEALRVEAGGHGGKGLGLGGCCQ